MKCLLTTLLCHTRLTQRPPVIVRGASTPDIPKSKFNILIKSKRSGAERFGHSLEGVFPVFQLLRLFGQQRRCAGRRSCVKLRHSDQISRSVVSSFCDPMNCSTPGLPVHHHLPEFTETHVHRVSDAIQASHPLSSPSPPAPNPSQYQSLFQ